jgi:hypothetical protein
MSVSNDLALVYTGSRVEGLFLEELLKENGIGVFKKDTLDESVIAGWANGSPEDACLLFVETENAEKAKKILDEYFASRDKK